MYKKVPKELHKSIIKRPSTIYLDYSARESGNKFLYCVYRVIRVLHVSLWFYTLPFMFLVVMYMTPVYVQWKEKQD